MRLLKYLANLGYGSRREVAQLLAGGRVRHTDGHDLDASSPIVHEQILIDGEPLDPAPGVLVLLNKPAGYVCSTTDTNPLVYDLLPHRFRLRSPIVAPVGRLDRDTSGLLLLTDDGQLNHRITSPRASLSKIYEATLAEDLRGDEADRFAGGTMLLEGESSPLEPASLEVLGSRQARLALTEGRYHQVRRMFAAVGNHVLELRRVAIGGLTLGDLEPGAWRIVVGEELERFRAELSNRPPSSSRRAP